MRDIRPTAGAETSADLYAHARHAGLAYDLYAAFDDGRDPKTAFQDPSLSLVALIYGAPGPGSERSAKAQARSSTLYGVVADEVASGRRYVVFRGTLQPAEWARNLQAGQRSWPETESRRRAASRVHAGFLKIFESLKIEGDAGPRPYSEVAAQLFSGRDTVFVGHSLGGALAQLAGVDAALRVPESRGRMRVVTLASPRVGDPGFAAMAAGALRIDRVCNLADIVPTVPPSTRRITYQHAGTPFRVSSFDWPFLANELEKAGDQVLCWHGDNSYAAMLSPAHADRSPAQCFKPAP